MPLSVPESLATLTSTIRFFSSRSGFSIGYTQLGQRIAAIYQINDGPITYMWEPAEEN